MRKTTIKLQDLRWKIYLKAKSEKSRVSVTKNTKKSKTEVLTTNYDFRKMIPEGLSGVSENVAVLVMRARAIKLSLIFCK